MLTRSIIALAMMLGAGTATSAATKHGPAPLQNVYNPHGACVGRDPDLHMRFEPWRDCERGEDFSPPEATNDQLTIGRF